MPSNPPFKTPATYNTQLNPIAELLFRGWVDQNRVPFDPNTPGPTDYDMRGYWQAMQQGNPVARSSIDPHDNRPHYPDYWKTPLHQTFSNESQWAGQGAPQWINNAQLASAGGRILHDARTPEQQRSGILAALMDLK